MPTYLVHGFRWHRQSIRIHVIVNDLEDATPDWLLAPATSMTFLNSFYTLFDFLPPSIPPPSAYAHIPIPPIPGEEAEEEDNEKVEVLQEHPPTSKLKKTKSMISLRSRSRSFKSRQPVDLPPPLPMYGNGYGNGTGQFDRKGSATSSDARRSNASGSVRSQSVKPDKKSSFNDWSAVKLLEQYDPSDMKSVSQPHAYVADYVVEISLGVAILEEMAKYEATMDTQDVPISPEMYQTPSTSKSSVDSSPHTSSSIQDLRKRDRCPLWLEKLRDGLQSGEDIGWHVVVCGDEDRFSPPKSSKRYSDDSSFRPPRSAGFKGMFRKGSIYDI